MSIPKAVRESSPEMFEIFDAEGRLLGLKPRADVHRDGDWHKSAQVLVFDLQARLLIQQRAGDKDLCPGLWDYSVGEHLLAGESFEAGALRGLREELGIRDVALTPLGELSAHTWLSAGISDRELQRCFRCTCVVQSASGIVPAPDEVQQIQWISLPDLEQWMRTEVDSFTPWFKSLVDRLCLFAAS